MNLNLKLDAWLLPFVNVYVIAGYIWNTSETRIQVSLPPILPGGAERIREVTAETSLEGSVGGVGMTLAGGYGPFFMTYDANLAQADLGFDDRFKAVVTAIRGGWGRTPDAAVPDVVSVADWNTFATATGTVADPSGGTLSFEWIGARVPIHAWPRRCYGPTRGRFAATEAWTATVAGTCADSCLPIRAPQRAAAPFLHAVLGRFPVQQRSNQARM
jgi:hypothetical protein